MVDVELSPQDIIDLQNQIGEQPITEVRIEGTRELRGRLMGATPVEVGE